MSDHSNDEYEPSTRKKRNLQEKGLSEDVINSCLFKEQYKKLLKQFKLHDPQSIKLYQQLKFKDNLYARDQSVMVYNLRQEIFAGKIRKIVNIQDGFGYYIPLLKIQWYYTKEDVVIPSKYENCLSEKELFLSDQSEYLPVDRIIRKITVLTFDEYDKLEWEEDYIYFSRAGLEVKRMSLIPPIKMWDKSCICGVPQNPDLQFIQCDKCKNWFHPECLQLTTEQIEAIEIFICNPCKQ